MGGNSALPPQLVIELGKRLHVVGPFKGGRVFHFLLAQAALQLVDGFIFVFFHPGLHY